MHLFRIVWYETQDENKYKAERRYELLGPPEAVFRLWFLLRETWRHVEIYNLQGAPCDPARGLDGLVGYAL